MRPHQYIIIQRAEAWSTSVQLAPLLHTTVQRLFCNKAKGNEQ